MEFEATLDTLTATVATFSVPIVTRLKDVSVPVSAVITITADSGTFVNTDEWKAARKYIIQIEKSGV